MLISLSRAVFLVLFVIYSQFSFAQNTGDYRSSSTSAATVDLSSPLGWEKYDVLLGWVPLSGLSLNPLAGAVNGSLITIHSGDTWSNSFAATVPSGVTVVLQGNSGTFSTINKITLNGNYRHESATNAATILAGMTLGSSSTFSYSASGAQTIPPGTGYQNLSISGSGNKTLGGNVTISGNLTLSSGMLLLGNNNVTVSGIISGSASSYIMTDGTGAVTVNGVGGAAKTFPVGRSSYNPVVISNGSNLNWTVHVKDAVQNLSEALQSNTVNRTWDITPSGVPAGATVIFEYNDSEAGGQTTASFNPGVDVFVRNYHTSSWTLCGGAKTPSGTPGGRRTVTITNQTAFSPFVVTGMGSALPVSFTKVSVTKKENGALLSFTNHSEESVLEYVIERSADGQAFSRISAISPKNSSGETSYSYHDRHVAGTIFYRVKAVEISGRQLYSPVVRLLSAAKSSSVEIAGTTHAGSPLAIGFHDLPAGEYTLRIFNNIGQLTFSKNIHHAGGTAVNTLSCNLQPGLFYLHVSGAAELKRSFQVR